MDPQWRAKFDALARVREYMLESSELGSPSHRIETRWKLSQNRGRRAQERSAASSKSRRPERALAALTLKHRRFASVGSASSSPPAVTQAARRWKPGEPLEGESRRPTLSTSLASSRARPKRRSWPPPRQARRTYPDEFAQYWKHTGSSGPARGRRRAAQARVDKLIWGGGGSSIGQFILERRPFAAHVTLLRTARAPKSLPPLPDIEWPVREFVLARSTVSARGSTYEIAERFALQDPG